MAMLQDEIDRLGALIDAEVDEDQKAYLCAAYQAINWAHAPDAFAPPSEMILSAELKA